MPNTRSWRSAWLCALWLISGCALLSRAPEPITYPEADARPIDLYGALPEAPTGRLESGEAALQRAFREDEMLKHLRSVNAKYSGRRRSSLAWTASARFLTEPPALEAESSEKTEEDPEASRTETENIDVDETSKPPLESAIEADGGYWAVVFASNVRETQVYYVCELSLSVGAELLVSFETKSACGWRNRKPRGA